MTEIVKADKVEAHRRQRTLAGGGGLACAPETLAAIAAAYDRHDWLTLGYESWDAYLAGEFGRHDRHVASLLSGRKAPARDTRSVYFIQAEQGGLIKIGVAGKPTARLAEIQRMCPVPLRIVGTIAGAGGTGELELHQRFAASRRHGEWFEPTPELCDYIRGHAKPVGAR